MRDNHCVVVERWSLLFHDRAGAESEYYVRSCLHDIVRGQNPSGGVVVSVKRDGHEKKMRFSIGEGNHNICSL